MRQFVRRKIVSFSRPFQNKMRWALNFDGVGVRGVLANRAINPDGDIDIEWEQLDYDTTSFGASSIVTQCLTATFASRELMLRIEANESIALYFGGNVVTTPVNFYGPGKWRITLIGSSWVVYKNGLVVYSTSFTRGTAREPSAQTVIGARNNGGTFVDYKKGALYNVKINGTRWPMADYNQAIQLPEPSGLGAELLVNPSVASDGSSWGKNNIIVESLSSNHFRLINAISSYAGAIFQTIPTTIGNKYVIRFKVGFQTGGTNFRVSINSTAAAQYTGDLLAANYTMSDQYLFVVFTATTTSATVRLLCNSSGAGSYVDVLDLTVKPLGTCNPMTISNATSANWMQVVDDYVRKFRSVLRFDGVGARGAFPNRAINPDEDIDIEWTQLGVTNGVIISQCISSTGSLREMFLRWNGGLLDFQVGGNVIVAISDNITISSGNWRLTYIGSAITVRRDGMVVLSLNRGRGASREPTAQTVVGARLNNSSYLEYLSGIIFNLKVNGTLWPIADRNQSIQLPEPSGLGAEMITQSVLENPHSVGSQWTYLGDGRWQYIGDGTLNVLQFTSNVNHPIQGFLEFEVESVSGIMACATGQMPSSQFTTAGKFRYFYLDRSIANNLVQFKRVGSSSASCIIKNISFKPLDTCNPIVLANVASANWEDLEI